MRRGYNPSVPGQIRQVAKSLHRLHRDDKVRTALFYKVRINFSRGETEIGLDVPSSLAHAVHLGLLEFEPGSRCGVCNDGGDCEDSLSSDASEYDVLLHNLLLVSEFAL